MKNKVLVKVYVPNIDEEYEIYIPTNESVKKIIELIVKSVYELSDFSFDVDKSHYIFDPETSSLYMEDLIIRDTNINNNKKIILV